MFFTPPQPGDIVLKINGKVFAVVDDIASIELVRVGKSPEDPADILCQCLLDGYHPRAETQPPMERNRGIY
jgi:hypothetical protein